LICVIKKNADVHDRFQVMWCWF